MQTQEMSVVDYLQQYSDVLIAKVESTSKPLVTEFERPNVELLREPLASQWKRIQATIASWRANRFGVMKSADTGTGKTIMGIVSCHVHAEGKPYRALVMCPSHLQKKWVREIQLTLPVVKVVIVERYGEILKLRHKKPTCAEWYVVSSNKAKMATKWVPAFNVKLTKPDVEEVDGEEIVEEPEDVQSHVLTCPSCGCVLMRRATESNESVLVTMTEDYLAKQHRRCLECDEPLYQWTHNIDRWPIANVVQRQARKAFRYLVIDETHQARSETTAIGVAVGKLASTIPYSVGLTGTTLNGYADSMLALSYRLFPSQLVKQGLKWGETLEFNRRYGRIETILTYKNEEAYANRQSKSSKGRTVTTKIKPGIMPNMYGDCLINNSVFCSLSDLEYDLPPLNEHIHPVAMDSELADAYADLEDNVRNAIQSMLRSGSKAAMAILVNTLNGWPDHPNGFGPIGYTTRDGRYVHVATPPNLELLHREKEMALLSEVEKAVDAGRQVWVYSQMTIKHDVQERLLKLFESRGLRTKILRSSTVAPKDREEWIYKHGADVDVMLSNPALVETGMDLFAPNKNHNFSSLMFYQCGFILDRLRQAAGRAHRVGQWLPCDVHFFYYQKTLQESTVNLMSAKMAAARAIEGKFSASGLSALTESDESITMMLARSLAA